ncbi:SDR family oxidoreductase [Roseimaritima ulvae]|uniref:Serine 3-dehydrogenase n=1 Tax=Roseimaritima ulvae TaxID=980254 RepID=A0A5B9QNN1_9BACT|nr:SDR family oxidoreductase [Roseimaritima ulvae]QEG40628.1 Serine 3-dehydrogenase [Roseimaritima ulvae]
MTDRNDFTTNEAATVLVTGCASGIGQATVETLDRAGYLVFAGVRREADIQTLRDNCSQRVRPMILDVTDEQSIHAAFAQVSEAVGKRGLDAIVNNAGIAVAGPLEHLPIERLQRQFDVNLFGVLRVCQTFLPLLRQAAKSPGPRQNARPRPRPRPRIVLIGSVASGLSLPLLGGYAGSKAALARVSDALRIELQPWNLCVSLIEPGSVVTPIVDKGIASSRQDMAELSDTARQQYEDTIAAVTNTLSTNVQKGIAASVVADKVLRVLRARHPRARYLVGSESRFVALLVRYTPLRWRDALLTRAMRLPRPGSKL